MAARQLDTSACMLSAEGVKSMSLITAFMRDKSGATAIEYALVASLVSIIIVGSVAVIGSEVFGMFSAVAKGFP